MNKIKVILAFTVFFLLGVIFVYFIQNNKVYTSSNFIMDTIVNLDIKGKEAKECGQQIIKDLNEFENKYSMYKEGSYIDNINKNAGENYVPVSDDVFDLLKSSYEFCDQSNGRFDITIAPLIEAWNIKSGQNKIPDITKELLDKVDYKSILFNEEEKSVKLLEKGQKIDLGGIAKGAACDYVYKTLEQYNIKEAIVSVGGNVVLYGKNTNDINVGIKNPRGEDLVGHLKSNKKIIATSGDYERYFELDGKRYHHILDTKTGFPFESDFYSVTVACDEGAKGDYLSTMIFMMNKEQLSSLYDRDDFYFVAVGKDNKIYKSKNLDFKISNSEYKLNE